MTFGMFKTSTRDKTTTPLNHRDTLILSILDMIYKEIKGMDKSKEPNKFRETTSL